MTIFLAIFSALLGLLLVFGGYQLARILIPFMGFLAGLTVGGAIIADTAGTSFLGTTLGILVGIASGVVLAIFSYMFYYAAVVIFTAAIGYWAGSGLMLWLGFSPGLVSALIGLAGGAALGLVGVLTNVPKYLLILLTAGVGAVMSVGGVLLLFHKIPVEVFSYKTASLAISYSFFWSMVAVALAVVGALAQHSLARSYKLEEWNFTDENTHYPTISSAHTA